MDAYPNSVLDLRVQSDGSIKDVVSGVKGIISRVGAKYGMGVDGKLHFFEGAATNYLLHSGFEVDGNADGIADGWTVLKTVTGAPTYSLVASPKRGVNAQRIQYTGNAGDIAAYIRLYQATTAGTFAAGDDAVFSVMVKGTAAGISLDIVLAAYTSAGVYIAEAGNYTTPVTAGWSLKEIKYPSLPATTSYVMARVVVSTIDNTDTCDIYIDGAQVEKCPNGTFLQPFRPQSNALLNNSFEVDSNADGLSDSWVEYQMTNMASKIYTRPNEPQGGDAGNSAQRIQLTGGAGVGAYPALIQTYAGNDVSAGDYWVVSGWVKIASATSPILAGLLIELRDASSSLLGSNTQSVVAGAGWTFVQVPLGLLANTAKIEVRCGLISGMANGLSIDMSFDNIRLERWYYSSPYVATTTATVKREGCLAAEPYTLGWKALIEEAKRNYCFNAVPFKFGGQLATGWQASTSGAVVQTNFITDGIMERFGQGQRMVVSNAGVSGTAAHLSPSSGAASFAAGDSCIFSAYLRAIQSGTTVDIYIVSFDAANAVLGSSSSGALAVTGNYQRFKVSYASMPANTDHIKVCVRVNSIDAGDTCTYDWCCCMVEKGSSMTSFVPTNDNATIVRPADVVAFNTPAWGSNAKNTIAVVAMKPPNLSQGRYFTWYDAGNSLNYSLIRENTANNLGQIAVNGQATANLSSPSSADTNFHTLMLAYDGGGGNNSRCNLDGSNGALVTVTAWAQAPALMWIGQSPFVSAFLNNYFHRMVMFNTRVADADLALLGINILNGIADFIPKLSNL